MQITAQPNSPLLFSTRDNYVVYESEGITPPEFIFKIRSNPSSSDLIIRILSEGEEVLTILGSDNSEISINSFNTSSDYGSISILYNLYECLLLNPQIFDKLYIDIDNLTLNATLVDYKNYNVEYTPDNIIESITYIPVIGSFNDVKCNIIYNDNIINLSKYNQEKVGAIDISGPFKHYKSYEPINFRVSIYNIVNNITIPRTLLYRDYILLPSNLNQLSDIQDYIYYTNLDNDINFLTAINSMDSEIIAISYITDGEVLRFNQGEIIFQQISSGKYKRVDSYIKCNPGELYLINPTGIRVSNIINISSSDNYNPETIYYINDFGGISSYSFDTSRNSSNNQSVELDTFIKNRDKPLTDEYIETQQINRKITNEYSLTTKNIIDTLQAEELCRSSYTYKLIDNQRVGLIINSFNISSEVNGVKNFTINYTMSYE